MGALKDCEAIAGPLLGQPVNTLTSLAFVAGGVVLLGMGRVRWVAWGLVATGIGSVLFHGPMPSYGEWAHDVSLAWLLLTVVGTIAGWRPLVHLFGLSALAVAFAVFPPLGDPVGAVLGVGAVIAVLVDSKSRAIGPVALLVAAAIIGRFGATGNPLCDPDSILQPHALWHLGATAAVVWWGSTTDD